MGSRELLELGACSVRLYNLARGDNDLPSQEEIAWFAIEITKGLLDMKKVNMAHFDLKGQNVVFTMDYKNV